MSSADEYRVKAAEFHAKAERETNPAKRAHLEAMVIGYLKVAALAEHNSRKPGVAPPATIQRETGETPDKS